MATSLRLSVDVKKRIAKLSALQDVTPHSFMLAAISEKLDADEARLAFEAEAERRLAKMRRTGKAIPAQEVFDYIRSRSSGKPLPRPKARRIP